MNATNSLFVILGFLCLLACAGLLYKTLPRAGRPDSAWIRTEARAVGMAMAVLALFFLGITMFLKGLL